jgi:hypothetical protein
MRSKVQYPLVFAALVLGSCDVARRINVNGSRAYGATSSCGAVEVKAHRFHEKLLVSLKFQGMGFIFHKQLFTLSTPDGREYYQFDLNGQPITADSVKVNNGDVVVANIPPNATKQFKILPGRYVSCDHKRVVQDTLIFY